MYLPDDLYARARAHALPLSALTQCAVEAALQGAGTDGWIERVRAREPRLTQHIDTAAVLAEVRVKFGR